MKINGIDVIHYKETDSTNLRAKEAGGRKEIKDTLFVAEKQTAGAGRRGRSWESPAGDNIYMSLLLKPDIEPEKAPMLTIVMATAVACGIRRFLDDKKMTCNGDNASERIQIKWPNDLVFNKKKLCGILTEMALNGTEIKYVVIGIGINVNQKEFAPELLEKATSLAIELLDEFDKEALISVVLEEFYKYYDGFLRAGDLSYLQEIYEQMLVNCGQEVVIHEPENEYSARAIGINEQGELLVEMADGKVQKIYAGEVSVRGIYGYV